MLLTELPEIGISPPATTFMFTDTILYKTTSIVDVATPPSLFNSSGMF
jgi:hypothetical protein